MKTSTCVGDESVTEDGPRLVNQSGCSLLMASYSVSELVAESWACVRTLLREAGAPAWVVPAAGAHPQTTQFITNATAVNVRIVMGSVSAAIWNESAAAARPEAAGAWSAGP